MKLIFLHKFSNLLHFMHTRCPAFVYKALYIIILCVCVCTRIKKVYKAVFVIILSLFFTTLKMIQTPNYHFLTLKAFSATSPDTWILTLSIPASIQYNDNMYFNFIKHEWIRDIQIYSVGVDCAKQTVLVKCRRNHYIDLRHINKPIAVLQEYISIGAAPGA